MSLRAVAPLLLVGILLLAGPVSAQEPSPEAPTAARDLPRGAVLTREDVVPAGAGAALPLGWVTRRVVSAGEPLRAPTIAPPDLVTAGETVQLVWDVEGVELRLRGRALGSAALGERVKVRVDTRRRFEGVVVGRSLIRIEADERN